jgi:hypothetical protein
MRMNRASRTGAGGSTRPSALRLLVMVPLLALACAACAESVTGRPSALPVPVLSATQTVRQSLVDLAEAGVLHYRGTLVNPTGRQVGLDVSVTATGEAGGTITVGGQHGSLVVVDGALYVDAPARFWSNLSDDPGSQAEAEDSRWVKVPSVTIGIDVGAMLRPGAFGDTLARLADPTRRQPLSAEPTATDAGTKAARVGIGTGSVDVAEGGAHGVLHVSLPGGMGNAKNVSLDVADVSPSEAGVYRSLAQQAKQLSTAVDTGITIQQGGQHWGACGAAACSVVVTFANAGSVATKVVVSGDWQGDHQPTGTCQAVVGPVAAGKSASATCTNDTPQWMSFFGHAHTTPGSHPYEVDWTAEALAAPPNLATLADEAGAAATPPPADPKHTSGQAFVYEIDYQDTAAHPAVWKYGVTNTGAWRPVALAQLAACRSVSHTSCAAALVTSTPDRPSADALIAALVARTKGCPPGQWVDCAPSAAR